MTRVQQAGDRIEELLGVLAGTGKGAVAEELVRLLVGLYGDGLAHIVGALQDDGDAGAAILERLTGDPLIESLLLLHGLHPLDVDARIQRALDRVRPYLGSHAGGLTILVCSVRGTLYAYRDACAACGTGMGSGQLAREVLTCKCGAAYDVSRAGRGLTDPALHLDPLPLVTDSHGVRVAVPAAAQS